MIIEQCAAGNGTESGNGCGASKKKVDVPLSKLRASCRARLPDGRAMRGLYNANLALVAALARRLVTPQRGQRLAYGLRPDFRADLFQRPDAGTERVAIVLDDLGQLPEQRFGLFVC